IELLRQVKYLVEDRGLNLAGVQLALDLTRRLRIVRAQAEQLSRETTQTRQDWVAGKTFGLLRDEMDDVLRMLGFIEERPVDRHANGDGASGAASGR
ncbi:MAG: hypothetical protein ACR2OO_03045, partial [Thermomicrobiales bacterium]